MLLLIAVLGGCGGSSLSGNCRKTYPAPASENKDSFGGQLVVFTGGLGDKEDIWVIRADGSGAQRLTSNPGREWAPTWSPDGRRIAFNRQCWDGSDEFLDTHVYTYVMNADGSGERRLVPRGYETRAPVWSPDGRTIALGNSDGIATVMEDGTGLRQLTTVAGDRSPTWSPDGRQIAFLRFPPDGSIDDGEIYVMNADGSGLRRLASSVFGAGGLDWSPDGRTIAFTRGPVEIWLMSSDGSDQRRLTQGSAPSWSPDGREIAFDRPAQDRNREAGSSDVWVMNADGTGQWVLVEDGGEPAWQPLPARG